MGMTIPLKKGASKAMAATGELDKDVTATPSVRGRKAPGDRGGRRVGLARAADSVRQRRHRSPLYALVEFDLRFWLGERVVVLIDLDRSILPCGRSACRGDRRRACRLADVAGRCRFRPQQQRFLLLVRFGLRACCHACFQGVIERVDDLLTGIDDPISAVAEREQQRQCGANGRCLVARCALITKMPPSEKR